MKKNTQSKIKASISEKIDEPHKNSLLNSDNSFKESSSFGFIDGVKGGAIYGWCYSGVYGKLETVRFIIKDSVVGQVIADQFRPDLRDVGYNDGFCAFVWKIPRNYLVSSENIVVTVVTSDGVMLENSPIMLYGNELAESFNEGNKLAKAKQPEFTSLNLFEEDDFKLSLTSRMTMQKGSNSLTSGWEMYCSSEDTSKISYWVSTVENYGSEIIETVLRVKSRNTIKTLHIFGDFLRPNYFFCRPLTLSFILGNQNKSNFLSTKLKLITRDLGGNITSHFGVEITQSPATSGEVSITIPADVINLLPFDNSISTAIQFEFSGLIDFEIGKFSFGFGKSTKVISAGILDGFEDSNISKQFDEILGFNNTGAVNINRQCAVPKWRNSSTTLLPEIIIPIYDALDYVKDCLESILINTNIPYLLTLIDDGSLPDVGEWIDEFARNRPWIKVIHNHKNIGYTLSINRAIRESSGGSLVLLNSDTIVSNGWLEKLIYAAESDPKIGIVGPMSNAASWQSLPKIKDENGNWSINQLPVGVTVNQYAEKLNVVSSGNCISVPVLNGFCLYVKRSVLNEIGLFDESAFPDGYGEENDFCFRAIDAGYELQLVTNAYVFHSKTKSFGVERRKILITKANKILNERYGEDRFIALEKYLTEQSLLSDLREKMALEESSNV